MYHLTFLICRWQSVDSSSKCNIEALKARTVKASGNAPELVPLEFNSAEGADYCAGEIRVAESALSALRTVLTHRVPGPAAQAVTVRAFGASDNDK
jgi:hypothetical protein